MKVRKGCPYLLHWKDNPFWWNENLDAIKDLKNVVKKNGRYYTIVFPHYTGDFEVVDCTCDKYTGDFYPIHTSLLKEK